MALYASWSPGIAFMPAEFPANADGLMLVNGIPWTDVVGLRQSGGTTFQGQAGAANWFHVPIATPVIVNDIRVKLVQIFVMFLCGDPNVNFAPNAGANVTDIHVWDGPNRIHKFGPFNLFGEHRFRLDNNNTHQLPMPLPNIFFGVELAVHVTFSANQTVTFASAGADFQV
jgi:hypothetical protein